MAIDYWKLTKDFNPGDVVQKLMPGRSEISPYIGRVTAVMPGVGFLDVQWSFGVERVSPEELVKANPETLKFLPPTVTFGYYPGIDAGPAAKLATTPVIKPGGSPLWRTIELPQGFHRKLAQLFHKRVSAIQAYDSLWHEFRQADDEVLRDEVQKFYRVAHNLMGVFLSEHARKTAAYWTEKDRKYRATKSEVETRKLSCPKCKEGPMRKATYKMEDGVKTKLFACPHCMYLVKQSDVRDPDGQPLNW